MHLLMIAKCLWQLRSRCCLRLKQRRLKLALIPVRDGQAEPRFEASQYELRDAFDLLLVRRAQRDVIALESSIERCAADTQHFACDSLVAAGLLEDT